MHAARSGTLFAATAYILWGVLPIYWKLLASIRSDEVLAHRMIWSLATVSLLLSLRSGFGVLQRLRSEPRLLAVYGLSAILVGGNWFLYIWGVNSGHVLDCSLGYFMTPLFVVFLGFIVLGERLRRAQQLAVALAALAVLYQIIQAGTLPWIGLGLALSFSLYGLVRKLGALESMEGLFLESLVLVLPAFLYLLYLDSNTASDFVAYPLLTKLLLAGAGPVTAIPLIMFAAGARRISMTTLGLLQYLAPTLQFACAVGLYGEAFTADNLVTFGLIWVALGIYSCDSYRC